MVVNVYYCVAYWTRKANKKKLRYEKAVGEFFIGETAMAIT